ncbi:ATP-binding protein [Streptomyces sp. NPDC006207]
MEHLITRDDSGRIPLDRPEPLRRVGLGHLFLGHHEESVALLECSLALAGGRFAVAVPSVRALRRAEAHAPGAAPEEVCDEIVYKVLRGATPQDGAALLLARTRTIAPDPVSSWTFPAEAPSVREARRAAHGRLAQWGLENHAPVTDLAVSELATNVIRHAKGPIRLRLILDRGLTVEVHDDADTAPYLRHARLQDEGGRGLFIVASLTRHWDTRYEESGTTIWAEQELPNP